MKLEAKFKAIDLEPEEKTLRGVTPFGARTKSARLEREIVSIGSEKTSSKVLESKNRTPVIFGGIESWYIFPETMMSSKKNLSERVEE